METCYVNVKRTRDGENNPQARTFVGITIGSLIITNVSHNVHDRLTIGHVELPCTVLSTAL